MGAGGNIGKQLTRVNKIALGFNRIIFDVVGNDVVAQLGVVDAVITGFHVAGKVFTNKAVKQGAKHILLKVPAIDSTAHIVSDLPDLALQGLALLDTRYYEDSDSIACA